MEADTILCTHTQVHEIANGDSIYYECDCGEKFHRCHHCGNELKANDAAFNLHAYCLGCLYRLGIYAKRARSKIRKRLNPNEYYETPEKALLVLGELLSDPQIAQHLPPGSIIWEPCDGNKRIGDFLQSRGYVVASTDILPRVPGVIKLDFLQTGTKNDPPLFRKNGSEKSEKCAAIVFNPPFAEFRKSQRWLRHALECSPLVIALLPQTVANQKGLIERYPPYFIKQIQHELHFETPFEKRPLSMYCNWYVWSRRFESDLTGWNAKRIWRRKPLKMP